MKLAAFLVFAAYSQFFGIALAEEPTFAAWDDLAPSTEPYDDPFLEMSYWQKDDLRTILQASFSTNDPELVQRADMARTRLSKDGLNADALLAQRLVVMEKRRDEATGVTGRLLGRDILLDGYALPLRADRGLVYSFLLVPWVGACIHAPSPPPNQMIRVDVPDGIEIEEVFHALRLRGVLEHKPTISNLFLVDGLMHVEASYVLTHAHVWGEPDEIVISSAAMPQGNFVTRTQAWISALFTTSMTSIGQSGSLGTVTFALFAAFLYGVLHTLGPGHGKAVVITYFVGQGGSLRRGVGMGVRIAIVHVFSAIAVVFLLDLAIRQTTGGPPSDYRLIRLGSYALIIGIGLWMVLKSLGSFHLRQRSNASTHDCVGSFGNAHAEAGCSACAAIERSASKPDRWLGMAVGIVPCTGALIVMLFGLANDLVLPAIAMVAAISLGMAISMSMVGIAALWSRELVARRIAWNGRTNNRLEASMRLGGATCVLLVGILLFSTTWMTPSQAMDPQTNGLSQIQDAKVSALKK